MAVREHIDWSDIASAAKLSAGNFLTWRDYYCGDDSLDEKWAIFYTHGRDSRLMAESNAAAIEKELDRFVNEDVESPDAKEYSASHWAVGWVDGYAIRVYRDDGSITEAFETYCGIQERLSDYPLLDEGGHSRREYEATLKNIESELYNFDYEFSGANEELAKEIYSWLWGNDQEEVYSVDDCGGYPDEDALESALRALGYLIEDVEV